MIGWFLRGGGLAGARRRDGGGRDHRCALAGVVIVVVDVGEWMKLLDFAIDSFSPQ